MTQFRIGVDWARTGFICWDAQPGDALNLLPTPLTWSGFDYLNNQSSTVTVEADLTDYGQQYFDVATSASVYSGVSIGIDSGATVDDIAVSPLTTYTLSLWVRGVSNYNFDFLVTAKDQTAATLGSMTQTPTGDWTRFDLTFTTGAGSTHVYFECVKNNNAALSEFDVSGFMLVAGSSAPTGFNTGRASDLYANVTDRVSSADWFLGMRQPYQDIADDSRLSLVLDNSDKRYSPEYASGVLASVLRPFRPVMVQSNDGTTLRTHWIGWIESLQPSVNRHQQRVTKITAAGPMQFLRAAQTELEVQENKRADEIIEQLIHEIVTPPALVRAWVIGRPGNSEIGQSTFIPDTSQPFIEPEAGISTFAFAADNWIRQGAKDKSGDEPTFDVYRAILDVTAAERGRFFFNRDGKAVFWNRHHLVDEMSIDATFDDTMTGLEYTYSSLRDVKNEVIVGCRPRTISATANEVLWELTEPLRIAKKDTRTMRVKYRDDNDNRIGGRDVTVTEVEFKKKKRTAEVLIDAEANSATLTFINNKSRDTELISCVVRGQKITDFGRMEATSTDYDSVVDYGRRTLKLDLLAVDNLDDAQGIADFERDRRSQPRGTVSAITVASHGVDSSNPSDPLYDVHTKQLALSMGARLVIKESQTHHGKESDYESTASYYIIGEAHRLTQGATLFETTWYLEPVPTWYPWKVGTSGRSELGQTTTLTY